MTDTSLSGGGASSPTIETDYDRVDTGGGSGSDGGDSGVVGTPDFGNDAVVQNPTQETPWRGDWEFTSGILNDALEPLTEALADAQGGGYAQLRQLLIEFGLESLYDTAVDWIADDSTAAEIELALREQPEYRERFSVIFEREAAGLPPVSPSEVVAYESQLSQLFSYWDVPITAGGSVQSMAGELLTGDVSLNEVQQRLAARATFSRRVLEDPDMDRAVVEEILGRGATAHDIAEFALNGDVALEDLERRLQAADVANEASGANNSVTASEAMDLARQGLTGEAARQGFGILNQSRQIVNRIVGDTADPIAREIELAALVGDVNAQAQIDAQRRNRVAVFDVGGGFAQDADGFSGLR